MDSSEQFRQDIERLKNCKGAEEYASQLVRIYLHNGLELKTLFLMAMDYGQQHLQNQEC